VHAECSAEIEAQHKLGTNDRINVEFNDSTLKILTSSDHLVHNQHFSTDLFIHINAFSYIMFRVL